MVRTIVSLVITSSLMLVGISPAFAQILPTSSPSPSPSPSVSPTASPTISPTASPTGSPTASPTTSPTGSPTVRPSPTGTLSPSPGPGCTPEERRAFVRGQARAKKAFKRALKQERQEFKETDATKQERKAFRKELKRERRAFMRALKAERAQFNAACARRSATTSSLTPFAVGPLLLFALVGLGAVLLLRRRRTLPAQRA